MDTKERLCKVFHAAVYTAFFLALCAGLFIDSSASDFCGEDHAALRTPAAHDETRTGTLASAPLQSERVRLYEGVSGIVAELVSMHDVPRAITIQGPDDTRNLGTGGVATCVAVCGIARNAQGKPVIAEAHWSAGYCPRGYLGESSSAVEAALREFLTTMHNEGAVDDTIELYLLGIWSTDSYFRKKIRALAQNHSRYIKGVFFNDADEYIDVVVTHEGIIYYDDVRNKAQPVPGSTTTMRFFSPEAMHRRSRSGSLVEISRYGNSSRMPLRREPIEAPGTSA